MLQNKSSAVAEMAAQCCTPQIFEKMGWVSFLEKLEQQHALHTNHTNPKTRMFPLHFSRRHDGSRFS